MANESNIENRVDQPTGTEFVGHEWDGIEELDTPLPRWWLWTFYATIVWAIGYVIAYPAWPMIDRATEGVIGWTSRGQLAEEISVANKAREGLLEQIAATDTALLADDPQLMQQAVAGGAAAFKVNCVQCHGAGAAGSPGYPNLNDDEWLWGGDLESIELTLQHGVRWDGSDQTRFSLMPGFGEVFTTEEINALAGHVLSFTNRSESSATGVQLYADNCLSCHGQSGEGSRDQGAPALNDAIWLYGSSETAIRGQIRAPSHGVMPGWKDRLDPATIKMLAAYVHSLGGGETLAQQAEEPAEAADEQP